MRFRIEQHGQTEWAVRNRTTNEVHYAQSAADAVALMQALKKAEESNDAQQA